MATTDRIRAILEAEDRASRTFFTVASALTDLTDVAVQAAAALVKDLGEALADTVAVAAEYESNVTNLAVALANQGRNTKAVRDDLLEFAATLTDVSQATENQIIQGLALFKSLGATDEAAKKLAQAGTDLAVITGNQEQAFRQLAATLGGTSGELGERVAAVKELTVEQRKAGQAADVVLEAFRGAGEAGARTFTGTVNNLNSAFEQLQRQIGGPVRDVLASFNNQAFIPLIKNLTSAVGETDAWRNAIIDTSIAVVRLVGSLDALARSLTPNLKSSTALGNALRKLTKELQVFRDGIDSLLKQGTANLSVFFQNWIKDLEALRGSSENNRDAILDLIENAIKPLSDSVTVAGERTIFFAEAIRNAIRGVEATTGVVATLGDEIRNSIGGVAVGFANDLSGALVDGFGAANESFGDFLVNLLKGLARAIAQALILRAILAAIGGGGSGPFNLGFAGIPGIPDIGGILGASVTPGLGGVSSAALPVPSNGAISIGLSLDDGIIAQRLNDGVERGSITITATKLKQVRNIR